jgi:hypothetical protein
MRVSGRCAPLSVVILAIVSLSCAGQSTNAGGMSSDSGDPYTCCAKGEGTACCSGAPAGTCFPYGGVEGDCVSAGGMFDGKEICALCCAGLTRVHLVGSGDGGACVLDGPPSLFVCVACGDGTCGAGENTCNCPGDCP